MTTRGYVTISIEYRLNPHLPEGLEGYLASTQKLYDLPADYWDTYPQRVAAVTADDVQRVARKYVDLDRLQVVAVGDASKVRQALAPYGTVEVYDTNGKPVAAAEKPGTN